MAIAAQKFLRLVESQFTTAGRQRDEISISCHAIEFLREKFVVLRRISQALKDVVEPLRLNELPGFGHRLFPNPQPVGYLEGMFEDSSLGDVVLGWRRRLPSAGLHFTRGLGHEPVHGKNWILGNHPCCKHLPLACRKASHLLLNLTYIHDPSQSRLPHSSSRPGEAGAAATNLAHPLKLSTPSKWPAMAVGCQKVAGILVSAFTSIRLSAISFLF